MARSKGSQSKHDAAVRRMASKLKRDGYKVKADVPGFPQPPTIGSVRPDVDARKGKQRIIGEIETPESVDSARDQKQQQAFRQAAARSENTKFIRKTTGK